MLHPLPYSTVLIEPAFRHDDGPLLVSVFGLVVRLDDLRQWVAAIHNRAELARPDSPNTRTPGSP